VSRRILHVADLHLGLGRFGAGAEEMEAMLARIAATADADGADIIVIAGDLFHTRRPAAPEILAFVRFLKDVTPKQAVLITSGNHDGPGEIEEVSAKPTGWLAAVDMPEVYAVPNDRSLVIRDVSFRVLPYVHRRSKRAAIIDRLVSEPPPLLGARYGPVFVGHQTVAGSRLTAENVMQIGWDLTVGLEAFKPYQVAMLGHIHHQQFLNPGVAYSGSPERFDFGEEEQEKGGLLWDMDTASAVHVDLGARQLLTIEMPDYVDDDWMDRITAGAVVRIIITGRVSGWQSLSRELHKAALEAGAMWVRVERREERGPRQRVAMDSNVDTMSALRSWCQVSGEDFESLEELAEEVVRA